MSDETRHTPGPWKVLQHARGYKKTAIVTASGAPIQAVIADMDQSSVATTQEAREANARLIAAAPELLALAKALMACAEPHRDRVELKAARALIRRVEASA